MGRPEQHDIHGEFLTQTFDRGEFSGRVFTAGASLVCESPVCTCGELKLSFREISDSPSNNRHNFDIVLSTVSRKLAQPRGRQREEDPEGYRFAVDFINDVTDTLWMQLAWLYDALMRERMRAIKDPGSIEIDFFMHNVAEGDLVGYTEVLPYADPFVISVDDAVYLVEDIYCISPVCHCTDPVLSFFMIADGDRADVPVAVLQYDYKTRTWSNFSDSSAPLPGIARIFKSAFALQYPAFRDELKERHRIMRRLYATYLDRYAAGLQPGFESVQDSRAAQPKPPGRNDPCPCGSGKKYKRCCGR